MKTYLVIDNLVKGAARNLGSVQALTLWAAFEVAKKTFGNDGRLLTVKETPNERRDYANTSANNPSIKLSTPANASRGSGSESFSRP